ATVATERLARQTSAFRHRVAGGGSLRSGLTSVPRAGVRSRGAHGERRDDGMAGMVGTAGRGDGRRRWARTAAGAAAAGPPRGEWPSPLRGVWLTAVLGMVLLAGLTTLFVTGLLSYAAYNPDLFE